MHEAGLGLGLRASDGPNAEATFNGPLKCQVGTKCPSLGNLTVTGERTR